MKRLLIFVCAVMLSTACASSDAAKKRFTLTLIVDPPDAEITVKPGGGQPEQKYSSPADITVQIPEDPAEAAKARLEIKRDDYKPMTIILNSIQAESTMRLKLSKVPELRYRMKLRMTHPKPSDDLSYRDNVLAIQLTPEERHFKISIRNLAEKPIHILWDSSRYTDCSNRPHRIIHPDVKPKDRKRRIPSQEIPVGGSLVQTIMPDDMAAYSNERKAYESKPLFTLDNDSALELKGRSFILSLPVEIDRAIIPNYNFQFSIVDVVKEAL